jgi:hypothetical protein
VAGPATQYKPRQSLIAKGGCQPANTSTWLSFAGDNYMYRYVAQGQAFLAHEAAAKTRSGFVWAPMSKQEQVGHKGRMEARMQRLLIGPAAAPYVHALQHAK